MEDISKLTIPKLKALCKEKKLTGYSKLNKPGLITKLLEHPSLSNGPGSPSAVLAAPSQPKPVLVAQPAARGQPAASAALNIAGSCEAPSDPALRSIISHSNQLSQAHSVLEHAMQNTGHDPGMSAHIFRPVIPSALPPQIQDPAGASKSTSLSSGSLRPAPEEVPTEVVPKVVKRKGRAPIEVPKAKRSKLVNKAPLEPACTGKQPTLSRSDPSATKPAIPTVKVTREALQNRLPTAPGPSVSLKAKRKVFAPLIPSLAPSKDAPVTSHGKSPAVAVPVYDPVPFISDAGAPHTSFEFLCDDAPVSLRPVTLPPSISQRKKVQRLSSIFSLLYEKDLVALCSLCRLYRYSVHISASHILRRDFAGPRLDAMFKKYSPNMIDYWPYLRMRRAEGRGRKKQFLITFLGKSLATYPGIISHRLWACDNTKYLVVAAKFLLTSFFYQVSTGLNARFDIMSVVAVEEVIQGEIWKITANMDGEKYIYYVLEATCEVIGLPSPPNHELGMSAGSSRRNAAIRADWTAYIEHRLRSDNYPSQETLRDRLSWPNHEEYDHGISKIWINRVKGEGESGLVKLIIARRYVLACLVANSLSGRHMTSVEMDQEFNGRSGDGVTHIQKQRQRQVNLYLPSHHLVESVHLTSRVKTPLHPAVATVQTLGREYYILRDNGLQIGTEEDGVCEVWMGILCCNSEGVAL